MSPPPFGRIPPPLPPAGQQGTGLGTPHSAFENGRGGGVSPPLPIRLLPPETGGEEGLCFYRRALYQNILYGATRGSVRILWYGRAPSQWSAGDGYGRPWAPSEAWRTQCGLLGALERERGGVASVLGSPPLFPVPDPTACVRAGGRLAPRGSVITEPPRAPGGRRDEGWAPGLSLWDFLGGDAIMGP